MDNPTIHPDKKEKGFLGQRMVVMPKELRRVIKNNPITKNLYLTDIGYYPHAENHYRRREYGAEEYILIYCLEGRGWIETDSDFYEIFPNSYIIVPVNLSHKYGADPKNPWSIYWVHFSGLIAEKFYRKYVDEGTDDKNLVREIILNETQISYFENIITLLEKGFSTDIIEYVNIQLSQLLASFTYYDVHAKINYKKSSTEVVNSVIRFMQENIHTTLTIDDLANHLKYSPSYLYSLFKKGTGYSPINYFNHLKIQKACNYLSFTDKSIKEIAFILGYTDPFYFSRVFKKLIEVSPTEYRNKF